MAHLPSRVLTFALFAASLSSIVEATANGALKLDNYTFQKVTTIPGWSLLVKFDQSYAYGEKEDEFKAVCKQAYPVSNFLVGEVPVQEYGDKENDGLREQFKLKKEDFPAYFLFNQANSAGLRYSGSIKADQLVSWLRRNGVKIAPIGTIEELDAVAKKFLKAGHSDEHLAEAQKLAEGQFSDDRKASIYVKIMQKIKEKGEAYVESEIKRVAKLAEGKIAPEKKAELEEKLKVLNVFTEKDEL